MAQKTKRTQRVHWKPVLSAEGSVKMRLGRITDCCECVHIHPTVLRQLGWNMGQYVKVINDEGCTEIVRRISITDTPERDYVFLGEETFRFMCSRLHSPVTVKLSDLDMELP